MQRRNADKRRTNVMLIKENNWILLKRKEIEKRKLTSIADRSFQITKIDTNSIIFRFSPKSHAHSTINISRIQLYFDPKPKLMTASSNNDASHEYEIDRIMRYRKQNDKEYYYIHWKEYPADDNTWKPKENISKITLRIWEHQNQERTKKEFIERTKKRFAERTNDKWIIYMDKWITHARMSQ